MWKMMRIFAPQALKRFTLRIPIRRLGVLLPVLAFIIISSLINSSVASATPSQIIAGIGFTSALRRRVWFSFSWVTNFFREYLEMRIGYLLSRFASSIVQ